MYDFKETYSVEEFKEKMNATTLKIMPSPKKAGKFFFSWGPRRADCGYVADSIREQQDLVNPVISLMVNENGEGFYMLHNQGVAETVFTL